MQVQSPGHDVTFGPFRVSPSQRLLLLDGTPAKLGARAFDVLLALVERRDRLVSKNELLEVVWPNRVVEDNHLQVQIHALRKLFGPEVIATVPGRGYRFTATLDGTLPDVAQPQDEASHCRGSTDRKTADQPAGRTVGAVRARRRSAPRCAA